MDSYFGQLYLDLSDHIKTAVGEIRWIDQDFGQLEIFEMRPDVSFPCALIDFIAAEYSAISELGQIGEISVNIRLGFAPFSTSQQLAPQSVKEQALKYYDIEQKIFEAVQGWHNDFTQPFIRLRTVTEQREGDPIGLRVRVMTFTTAYEDESAIPVNQKVPVTAEIEQEIQI